ncbi:hypothetical protein ACQP3C_27280, partial [Escherichia coli]
MDGLCEVVSVPEQLHRGSSIYDIYGFFSIISNGFIIGGLTCLSTLEDPKTEIKEEIPFLWPGLFPEAGKECGRRAICPFCKT